MKDNMKGQRISGYMQTTQYFLQNRVDNIQFPFDIERNVLKADFISHEHDHIELLFVFHGTALHVIHGKEYFLKPGDVWVIMPGVKHGFKQVKSLDITNIIFGVDFLERFSEEVREMEIFKLLFSTQTHTKNDKNLRNYTHLLVEFQPAAGQLVGEILKEMSEKKTAYQSVVLSLLVRLLVFIDRSSAPKQEKEFSKVTERFASVIGYVESNYLQKVNMEKLASLSGLSREHINRHFKRNFQMTLNEFLINLRLEHAKELLSSSNSPITDIAFKSGFTDNNYFSRIFKTRVKMTPSEYRDNIKGR